MIYYFILDEFKPDEDDSDDEETIEKEEAEAGIDDKAQQDEIEALKKESEMPIEEILKNLPIGMLENESMEESQDSSEVSVARLFIYCFTTPESSISLFHGWWMLSVVGHQVALNYAQTCLVCDSFDTESLAHCISFKS